MSEDEAGTTQELSPLVAPFSLVFRRRWVAALFVFLFFSLSWLGFVLFRIIWFSWNIIYWKDELTMLIAFVAAGCFSLYLPHLFCDLCGDLVAQRSSLAENFGKQYRKFHDSRWLIPFPAALSTVFIIVRYAAGREFDPFQTWSVDFVFSIWLFFGFFTILHATVLCARYTEVAHLLREEAVEGRLSRNEIHTLSRFYLKVAIVATIHFGFCAMVMSAINMIYTYHGTMIWSPLDLIRWRKGLSFGQQFAAMIRDPLFPDIMVMLLLHAAVSIAPVVYLIFPQWDIHKLLVHRKEGLLAKARQDLEDIEGRLTPQSEIAEFDEFTRRSRNIESLERLPEWPFEVGGSIGTLMLVVLPTILILGKDILLEVFVNIITK
ncbi:MAG: hypothetical protein HQM09_22355 [Candidatus Riflebacteria bacterium]|nr:hypothetical protein [Candidatus Riflebacteria bacterium]